MALDIQALQKWQSIPKNLQNQLKGNVFCRNCRNTTINIDSINSDQFGIILTGTCIKCGGPVARVIED